MANRIEIQGLDDLVGSFDKAPNKCLKATRKAMQTAGREIAKNIKRNMPANAPSRWKRMIKAVIVKRDGKLDCLVGYFNNKQAGGHQGKKEIDDWFKAYWNEYGTLTYRDPKHKFKYSIKKTSKRRNNVGQRAAGTFEGAVQNWEKTFTSTLEAEMKKQIETLL